jgi:crotonobetaine/carnitine-CoA ligase
MHSQRSFVTCGEAFVQRVYLQEDDRVMVVLPLFHINALFYSVAGTLAAGCSMLIVRKFSASAFWHTVADNGVTQVNIIEAVGTILKNRPRSEFRPDHRLRVVYGVREAVAETFRGEFGIRHRIGGYGMTEIPGVACNPVEGPQKPGGHGPIAAWSTTKAAMLALARWESSGSKPRSSCRDISVIRSRPRQHFATTGS